MKLIAWDTSSKSGAIAALEWDAEHRDPRSTLKLRGEFQLNVDSAHSDQLLWGIDRLLQAVRWDLAEVDVLGVGVGPGSFTGLRIGITTARTLGHSLGKRVVPVSSLAALARPAAIALSGFDSKAFVIAATDACKGELYAMSGLARSFSDCVVQADGDLAGFWKRGVEQEVCTPEELLPRLKKRIGTEGRPWIVVGETRHRYPELWEKLPKKSRLEIGAFPDEVQGRWVAVLAWEAFQAGVLRSTLEIRPDYLRAPDAELKLKRGLLPPGPTR